MIAYKIKQFFALGLLTATKILYKRKEKEYCRKSFTRMSCSPQLYDDKISLN
jgi:hypothetical protein